MEISKYSHIEIMEETSSKGNVYRGLFIVIRDKDNQVVGRQLLKFLTKSQYDLLFSLIQK